MFAPAEAKAQILNLSLSHHPPKIHPTFLLIKKTLYKYAEKQATRCGTVSGHNDSVNIFSQILFQPFGSRQLADYEFGQIILKLSQMIHVHVTASAPLGSGYMPQSGTYQH